MEEDNSGYEILSAKVYPFRIGMEPWLAIAAEIDGEICKLLTIKNVIAMNTVSFKGCIVYKYTGESEGQYDAEIELQNAEKILIRNITEPAKSRYSHFDELVSGYLRQKIPIDQIIQLIRQFDLPKTIIHNWKSGIIRFISSYILDGAVLETIACSNCNAGGLIYYEGDLCCNSCGYSVIF
jgi:hypothetical protein